MEVEDKNIQGNDLQQQLIGWEMLQGLHSSPPSSSNQSLKESSEIEVTSKALVPEPYRQNEMCSTRLPSLFPAGEH